MKAAQRSWAETAGAALTVAAAGAAAVAPAFGWAACLGVAAGLALMGVGRGLRRPPAWGAVAVLAAMSLVSAGITQTPDATWPRVWQLWAGLGMFWGLAAWARTRERVAAVGAGLAGAGVALALASPFVVNWFTARKTFFPPSVYALFPRLVSDTVHPNIMAGALLCVIFIPLAWALTPPTVSARRTLARGLWGARGVWAVACLLMLVVLFLTKSRGAYAAFLAGGAILAVLMLRRRAALAAALFLAVALAVGVGYWALAGGAWQQPMESDILDTSTFAFRLRIWHYAAMLIGDFPLTGVGMGGFNVALRDLYGYAAFNQPGAHSLYLQAALDLGLPGLAALVAVIATAAWRAVAALRRLRAAGDDLWPLAAGAVASLAALLAQGLLDVAVWGTKGSILLWGLLALLYALGGVGSASDTAPARREADSPTPKS